MRENQRLARIGEALEQHGPMVPREIAERIGMAENMARAYLSKAASQGLVHRTKGEYTAAPGWRKALETGERLMPQVKRHPLDSWLARPEPCHSRIGQSIKQLCGVLEQHGALRTREVYQHFPELTPTSVRVNLHRAIEYRVIRRVKRGAYAVVPQWAERLRPLTKVKPFKPLAVTRHPLDSWLT